MENIDFKKVLFSKETVGINLLPARSSYKTYLCEDDLENLRSSERLFNDDWKIKVINNVFFLPHFLEYVFNAPFRDYDEIKVPLSLELQGYGFPRYINSQYPFDGYANVKRGEEISLFNPAFVYLKKFDYKKRDEDNRVIIDFKGFETALFLYMNGEFVGYSTNLYLDSEFDITPYIKEKGNIIAAVIFKYSISTFILSQDFYRFSGIFRDVTIKEEKPDAIYDIDVRYDVDFSNDAVKGEIVLTGAEKYKKVAYFNNGDSGFMFSSSSSSIPFSLNHPLLWSAEHPNLYKLTIITKDGDDIVDIKSLSTGFRDVSINEKAVLTFNQKRLKVKGINRNEWDYQTGRAIDSGTIDFDLDILKENNVNAIRTSHYPNNEYFYEAADKKGFYIIDEACLESHASFQDYKGCKNENSIPGNDSSWETLCSSRLLRMYERDKNHPSIFLWSLGNESGSGSILVKMHDKLKERYPKAIIHYEGVHFDRRYHCCSDVQSEMYTYPEDCKKHIDEYSDKPFMLCEYAHAMGNSFGNVDEYMDLFSYNERFFGCFIWDYIDLALYARNSRGKMALCYGGDFEEFPNDKEFCGDGIIFADRKKVDDSSKLVAMKYFYQPFSFAIDEKSVRIKNDFLFTDSSSFTFAFALVIDGQMVKREDLSIPLEPGESKEVPLPFDIYERGAYFDITVQIFAGRNSNGELVAREEKIFAPAEIYPIERNKVDYEIVEGNYNIGIIGDNFKILFGLANCTSHLPGLISLEYRGEEYMADTALPTLFRANTSNDIGNRFKIESGLSLLYSKNLFINNEDVEYGMKDDKFVISYSYRLSSLTDERIKVTYTVDVDGSLIVKMSGDKPKGIPSLPYFGMRFPISKLKKKFDYFALGDKENYPDRVGGSISRYFGSDVDKAFMPYLKPQDYGNHEKAREVDILGENSYLRFVKTDEYFSFKYLKNNEFELENATHVEELPSSFANYLEIAPKTRGVGGDNTWGAPVHEAYELKDDHYELEFRIELREEYHED